MLQRAGVVCEVLTGLRSLERSGAGTYDLVLLAAESGGAALPALTAYRRDGAGLPALVLASTLTDHEEEALFDAGADEVLPETTPPARLLARLRAAARRLPRNGAPACGNLSLDPARRLADVGGQNLPLTSSEFDLLASLVARQGRLVGKAACRTAIYRSGKAPASRTIDVFVCRLRRKLQATQANVTINTVWGRGYVLQASAPPNAGRA